MKPPRTLEEALPLIAQLLQRIVDLALGLMIPHAIHDGLAAAKWQQRAEVLRAAYAAHPERFPRGVPLPPPLSPEPALRAHLSGP